MPMREQGASEMIERDPNAVTATPGGLEFDGSRHPSVKHFGPLFAYGHLPEPLRVFSQQIAELAAELCSVLKDGPELAAGLRKLREAKDCFVTQAVTDRDARK
jgi:hypothetical protein